jgi:hypothetical protein
MAELIRNETYRDGVLVVAEIVDIDAGTISHEVKGVVKSTRPMTDDEAVAYAPAPVSVEDRIGILEAENAALRKALVNAAVLTDDAIEAEKVATLEVAVKG